MLPVFVLVHCFLNSDFAKFNVEKFSDRTERLAFSDFRLIGPFVNKCKRELQELNCQVGFWGNLGEILGLKMEKL